MINSNSPLLSQALHNLRLWKAGSKTPLRFLRSVARRIYYGLSVTPLVALVLGAVVLLKPLIKIRIGKLHCDRIGHLGPNTELYLRRRSRDAKSKREYHVFLACDPANRQLFKMIRRRMRVIESRVLVRMYDRTFQLIKDCVDAWIELPMSSNEYEEFNTIQPQLYFTDEEESWGEKLLADIGIDPGAPFVCFNARSRAYLDTIHNWRSREEWAYHDYRDCSIYNYLSAAEHLASLGMYAIRMGFIVEQELMHDSRRIVDYASRYRSDFGDIYLCAKCKFYLGSDGGLITVPWIFNVPVAFANSIPLRAPAWRRGDLFIPKKLWAREKKRFLTFREILKYGVDGWSHTEVFERAGIELVENTGEEILALAKEMNDRLDGSWITTEEDEELQRRYRGFIPPGHRAYGFPSRIGAEFLRQNRALLE